MTTVLLDAVYVPDSGWRVRSPFQPGWHPKPTATLEDDDKAKLEAAFKNWQSRRTVFEWRITPAAGDLAHLGFEASGE